MLAIQRIEKIWFAVQRDLGAQCRSQMRNDFEFMVIAGGVSLYARQKILFKASRLRLAIEQYLGGAVSIFNPCPEIVADGELYSGLSQIPVEILAGRQPVISSPQ